MTAPEVKKSTNVWGRADPCSHERMYNGFFSELLCSASVINVMNYIYY